MKFPLYPSANRAAQPPPGNPANVARASPVALPQIRAVPSWEAVASRVPPGENATPAR